MQRLSKRYTHSKPISDNYVHLCLYQQSVHSKFIVSVYKKWTENGKISTHWILLDVMEIDIHIDVAYTQSQYDGVESRRRL